MKPVACSLLLIFGALCTDAQIARKKIAPELTSFFTGKWAGRGEFANGRKISANVSFSLKLDSAWLVYEHEDQLPNHYKAIAYWSTDPASGQFKAYFFDNSHGARKFDSEGWKDGQLVLTNISELPGKKIYQHFIYKKLSDSSYRMTYETSRDSLSWKMGDYLVFVRQ